MEKLKKTINVKNKKIIKVCIILILMLAFYAMLTTKCQANFNISNFTIDCKVLENGDMEVEENIMYNTNETRNGVIRNIQISNPQNTKNSAKDIQLEGVFVNGELCQEVSHATNGQDKVYTYNKSGDEYEIKVYTPFKYAGKTITYKYLLKDVAVKYNDIGEIYWNFIGDGWDTFIDNVTIYITLPQKSARDTIYVYGHGSDDGRFMKRANFIALTAHNLKANQALDARILFSRDALTTSTKTVNKSVLNNYRKQEEGFTLEREQERIIFNFNINQITVILIIGVVLIAIYVFLKYDKEDKVEKIRYCTEIPNNLEPAIMQAIYYDGKVQKSSYWVTFLDLVRKGVFRLDKYTNEYGTETQKITLMKDTNNLSEHERLVKNEIKSCLDANNSTDMLKFTSKLKSKFGSGYRKYQKSINTKMQEMFGEEKKSPGKLKIIMAIIMIALILTIAFCATKTTGFSGAIGIVMFLGFITFIYSVVFATVPLNNAFTMGFLIFHCGAFQIGVLAMMIGSGVGLLYIPYILLFLTLQYSMRTKKYPKSQRQMKEKIKGLRRYLKKCSLINDKEIQDNILCEEYLIAAIALGLSRRTINYFYKYCRENIVDDFTDSLGVEKSYSRMYNNCGIVFYHYATRTIISSGSGSRSGSSFSGSSGGFSGGSSSGGGGRRWRRRKLFLKPEVRKHNARLKDNYSFDIIKYYFKNLTNYL